MSVFNKRLLWLGRLGFSYLIYVTILITVFLKARIRQKHDNCDNTIKHCILL